VNLRQLVNAAAHTAGTVDDLSASFAKLLADVLRDTERRLAPLVTAAGEGSTTAIIRAAQANRTRAQIRQVLTDAGFDHLIDLAAGVGLDPLVDSVLAGRKLAELSADLTPTAARRIEALKLLAHVDLLEEGEAAARALWRAVTRGIFGARPTDRILGDLAAIIDRTEPQIRTLYDTSVSVFGRQVEALQAGDDPKTPFVYLGPVDDKTRDWCLKHVGRVYRRSEIDQMDNGQIAPVFLCGGGFNCRHHFIEVSPYSDLAAYVGTDQRVPEVEAQLRRLKDAA
jgi:hypothetical protein